MKQDDLKLRSNAVRRFSRFYTQHIGALQSNLLDSSFSLTQARILYELAHREQPTASDLIKDLGLDPGYLSRMLRNLETQGILTKKISSVDARQNLLALTAKGRKAFATLDQRSHTQVEAMLKPLSNANQRRLLQAMTTIENLLSAKKTPESPYSLRPHQPGDIGWVVQRHGALYAQEYGWSSEFEALVAEIAAQFIRDFDPKTENCWIAERNGERVGSVFLVKQSTTVAKLRLLFVEPQARGLNIGRHLVKECIRFAKAHDYRRIMLWTNSILVAARGIYEAEGFRLVKSEPHHSFGKDLVGETWELKL